VIPVRDVLHLDSLQIRNHLWCLVLSHGVEERVNQTVGVSLSGLAHEAHVSETGVQEHLPDVRISPIVGSQLRPDLNIEVVVSSFKACVDWRVPVHRQANEVLSQLFERMLEGAFVVFALALAVADNSVSVADKEEHTSVVDSVKAGDISYRVTVNEDQGEMGSGEDFITAGAEEAFGTGAGDVLVAIDGSGVEVHVVGGIMAVLVLLLDSALLHEVEVVLHLLSAAEFFQHDHLIFAIVL